MYRKTHYLCIVALLCFAGTTQADCWQDAASPYGLDPNALGAIACVESGLNAHAVSRVGALGLMQVMPANARRVGLAPEKLFDVCTNIRMGAYLLAKLIARYGNTWVAVGAFNAACNRLRGKGCVDARAAYAWKVFRARRHLLETGRCD